ncbi:MAG: hypothetical protein ABJL99_07940 [Aliishimia sp.]
MANLTAEVSVVVPGEGLRTLDDLELDPALLDAMNQDARDDPNGAVMISKGPVFMLLEDSFWGIAGFMSRGLGHALETGADITYQFRSGPEKLVVQIKGEGVTLDYDGRKTMTTTVSDLKRVAANLSNDVDAIEALLES